MNRFMFNMSSSRLSAFTHTCFPGTRYDIVHLRADRSVIFINNCSADSHRSASRAHKGTNLSEYNANHHTHTCTQSHTSSCFLSELCPASFPLSCVFLPTLKEPVVFKCFFRSTQRPLNQCAVWALSVRGAVCFWSSGHGWLTSM